MCCKGLRPFKIEQEGCAYIVNEKELSRAAKDYLNQIQKTDRLIKRLLSTIQTLRSGLTSQNYELNPERKVQSSGPKDPIEETFARISELETEISEYKAELSKWKVNAFDQIKRVSDQDQQNILIARYISNEKWERIAVELNFSIAQVYRIHGAGLLAFAEKILKS